MSRHESDRGKQAGTAVITDPREWEQEFEHWLAPFWALLGDARRARWAPLYVRGLLSRSERKSIEPLVTQVQADVAPDRPRQTRVQYHHLQHFIAGSTWEIAPLATHLARCADEMLGGPDAMLAVDDTAIVKQGHQSVGVGHQYAGVVGKMANCQTLVSLTLARAEVPVCVGLTLYLPTDWTEDPRRCRRAGVPAADRRHRTKVEIALAEIARVRAAGVRFGLVTADAGYGCSAPFRHWLSAHGLRYAVGIQSHQLVYVAHATSTMPRLPLKARRPGSRLGTKPYRCGRTRVRPVASHARHPVADILRTASWRRVAWRHGTKGLLHGRFAAVRVRVADGVEGTQRQHLPGEVAWLVGERRTRTDTRYYLTNHPADTALPTLVAAIKSRWVCEQAHQQLKEELGLDHFEGRSWHGLHHHALLTMISFAFLQHLRLQQGTAQFAESPVRKKSAAEPRWWPGPPPMPTLPAVRRALRARLSMRILCCPHCHEHIPWRCSS